MKTFSAVVVGICVLAAGVSLSTVALAKVEAQQKKNVTAADFVGTWNIEMMSHQIALVVEPADANKVTATLMIMGNDMPLKGDVANDTLTLVGVKKEGDAPTNPHMQAAANAKPIVLTLQEDGTIAGEMVTNMGPTKFTGEKLRTKKKSQK